LDKDIGLIWSSQGYYGDHSLGLFARILSDPGRGWVFAGERPS
jgi:hypothetical protein